MLLVKEKEEKDNRISNYVIISISTCDDDETFIFESAGTKSSGSNHFNETFAYYFWYNPFSGILQIRKKVG